VNLVFCGTPQFAVASLERLASAGYRVPLVVTQPDRVAGPFRVYRARPF